MKDYNFLLGLPLKKAEEILRNNNLNYDIIEYDGKKVIKGKKVQRVVRVKTKEDSLELIVSFFRDEKL